MSYITNATIMFDGFTGEDGYDLEKINNWPGRENLGDFKMVENEGGTRHLEVGVATAAFNHLDDEQLLAHLRSLEGFDFLLLALKAQDDDEPRVFRIFPDYAKQYATLVEKFKDVAEAEDWDGMLRVLGDTMNFLSASSVDVDEGVFATQLWDVYHEVE